jgi:hypothetical protein
MSGKGFRLVSECRVWILSGVCARGVGAGLGVEWVAGSVEVDGVEGWS